MGADIGDCYRDAVMLAATERQDVQFVHNETVLQVKYDDLLSQVKHIGVESAKP